MHFYYQLCCTEPEVSGDNAAFGQMNINGASPAGGEVQAGTYTASAEADGPYLALNQVCHHFAFTL